MREAKSTLSRERILRAALSLVDAEGIDALSMRKLGALLGVEAMSLYRYVPSKAALLDALHERLLSELPPQTASGWREALRERATSLRSLLAAHPRAIVLFASRPAVTHGSMRHLEASLEVLRSAGLQATDALAVFQVVFGYVLGHALASFAPRPEQSPVDYRALPAEQFPRVLEAAAALDGYDADAEFSLGLDLLISGIAARYGGTLTSST